MVEEGVTPVIAETMFAPQLKILLLALLIVGELHFIVGMALVREMKPQLLVLQIVEIAGAAEEEIQQLIALTLGELGMGQQTSVNLAIQIIKSP